MIVDLESYLDCKATQFVIFPYDNSCKIQMFYDLQDYDQIELTSLDVPALVSKLKSFDFAPLGGEDSEFAVIYQRVNEYGRP